MNRYTAIGLVALLVLVAVLPVYAYLESGRMAGAQADLRHEFVAEGADLFVENCVVCHGPLGEGVGAMPPLNNPALAAADHDVLYATIAHAPHGSVMSAWHVDDGGGLNGYQVESLVTLIRNGDWARVDRLAVARGYEPPEPVVPEVELATMDATGEDPHECRACHEEPEVHAERFGLNCSRCHTLQAWKPALLTRHAFFLDHGGDGKVACQTCHTETYAENTCYECHDHDREQMRVVHVEEEAISEYENCVQCHPTGVEGEAASLGYGRSGQAARANPSGRIRVEPQGHDEPVSLGEAGGNDTGKGGQGGGQP